MRAALVQLCSGDDPAANLAATEALVREAAAGGAALVLTPECTNIVSADRARQRAVLRERGRGPDAGAARGGGGGARGLASDRLALPQGGEADGRFVNRSFLVGPDGAVRARYDKIHMFDVALGGRRELPRESAAYRPGERAVLAEAAGLTARDDRLLRPAVSAPLPRPGAGGGGGADACPRPSPCRPGEAHWDVLLRARAIETGAYVLAPAQSGTHAAASGAAAADLRPQPGGLALGRGAGRRRGGRGVSFVEIDPAEVARARGMVPSLGHDRDYAPPSGAMSDERRATRR